MYLACGVDPNITTIFKQSDVLAHGTLGFIMTFQTKMGELSRLRQFKYKSQQSAKESVDKKIFLWYNLIDKHKGGIGYV